jgi:hypothetical protein
MEPRRQKRLTSLKPDKGWQRRFNEPIPLPPAKRVTDTSRASLIIGEAQEGPMTDLKGNLPT